MKELRISSRALAKWAADQTWVDAWLLKEEFFPLEDLLAALSPLEPDVRALARSFPPDALVCRSPGKTPLVPAEGTVAIVGTAYQKGTLQLFQHPDAPAVRVAAEDVELESTVPHLGVRDLGLLIDVLDGANASYPLIRGFTGSIIDAASGGHQLQTMVGILSALPPALIRRLFESALEEAETLTARVKAPSVDLFPGHLLTGYDKLRDWIAAQVGASSHAWLVPPLWGDLPPASRAAALRLYREVPTMLLQFVVPILRQVRERMLEDPE